MKVYIAVEERGMYEIDHENRRVFDSELKASKFIDKQKYHYRFFIEEFDVE